jgi:hypothetical protein
MSGHRLKKLSIIIQGDTDPVGPTFWSQAIPDDVPIQPALREFALRRTWSEQSPEDRFSTDFFESLFRVSPNLEYISFNGNIYEPENQLNFFRALALIPDLKRLKKFVMDGIGQAGLNMLIQLGERAENGLQLKVFHTEYFGNVWRAGTSEILTRFLASQSRSLKTLGVGFHVNHSPTAVSVEIPILPELEEFFVLSYLKRDEDWASVRFESFALTFPKLTKLNWKQLHNRNWEHDPILARLAAERPGVLLSLEFQQESVPRTNLEDLALTFPAVQDITLALREKELLSVLWTAWPALKSLKVELKQSRRSSLKEEEETTSRTRSGKMFGREAARVNLSELITGVPAWRHDLLLSRINKGKGKSPKGLDNVKSGPGISDLQGMTALTEKDRPFTKGVV